MATRVTAVADIGCGEQPLRPAIVTVGARYLGVDVEQNRAGTVDVMADITEIPLPDACRDVVLCTEALGHVADIMRVRRVGAATASRRPPDRDYALRILAA